MALALINKAPAAIKIIVNLRSRRSERLDGVVHVGVDAKFTRNFERLLHDLLRGQIRVDQQRLGIEAGKAAQESAARGFDIRAAQQQEQLRNVLLDPKSTPEQRAVAQRNLAALSGKTAADRMQTVALPDTTNEMGQVVRGGQALVRVLEDGSVQQVPIGAQQGAALPPGMKRQIGTSNGRPVYEDMNGKKVIAKG
jgi:hypothetical protein